MVNEAQGPRGGAALDVDAVNQLVAAQPFHRFCGLEVIGLGPGEAVCRFVVGPNAANLVGNLHGGVACALMDVAAWAAVQTMLRSDEAAVSHDVHYSLVRPAPQRSTVELRGRVLKKGRSVAFVRVEAWRTVPAPEQLVAAGTVTKSILAAARPDVKDKGDNGAGCRGK